MILIDKAKLVDKAFKKVKEFASDNYHDGYDYALALIETMDKAEEVDAIPIEWMKQKYPPAVNHDSTRYISKVDLLNEIIEEWRKEE